MEDTGFLGSMVGMGFAGKSEGMVLLDNTEDMVSGDILGGIYNLDNSLDMV